ncbi:MULTISPECIES: hypothetical protein [unclassified Marinobacter]|uniref:SMODS and SLOG-associating 2TM effector domain-containing protein n=1 Tax=Marinobacter nauticus TaxID=2743 RepID=A0A455W7G4_MARNT|nr:MULTISPECIES: hypothetical protein [unclassified Marinobacter]QFS88099.1 hypothetical protein FIV08_14790 [Marinobacter sp. THAF197a]QFT51884.1 hypothetical protein FIU96_14700 [Marinobacter sp. THAF39]BBJ05130.1 hypothetical protein YBY_29790 [Marinobacter nauticus]
MGKEHTAHYEPSLESDLIRRIRLQRGVHDILEDKTQNWLSFQKIVNVCSGAFITLVVFADFGLISKLAPSASGLPVMLSVAVTALLVFIMNALYDVYSVSEKNATHLQAIQQYTDLLSDLKKAKYSNPQKRIDEATLMHCLSRYLQISASATNAGGNSFDKAQEKYLKRRALRKAREEIPFGSKKEVEQRAKSLTGQCKESEGEI